MIGFILPYLLILGQFGMGPGPGITAAPANACATAGYAHYRIVTIPAQVAMTADLSNYPVEVQGTYSYLATVANGGLVQNANGYDVVFFTDSTCSTKLNWQTEIYTAASGVVTYWVQVPTVSKTTSVTFVMAYDNAGISTDQSNATGTWDANFKAVYHLGNGTTLNSNDSTSNAINGTAANVTATAGNIDGGAGFNGNNTGTLSTIQTSGVISTVGNNITISAWINTTNNAQDGQMVFYNGSDNAGNGYGFALNEEGIHTGHIFLLYGGLAWVDSNTVVTSNAWHLVQVTITTGVNGPGTLANIYLDGTSVRTNGFANGFAAPTTLSEIGYDNYPTNRHFNGTIDECRFSTAARSADWIKTDYNSQSSPATFYSVGGQF